MDWINEGAWKADFNRRRSEKAHEATGARAAVFWTIDEVGNAAGN